MTPDETLNALLKKTRGIEPSPGFENAVWRQIHAVPLPSMIRWRSWMTPLALAAGLLLGIGLGVLFPAGGQTGKTPTIVRNGSLTGAYLMLASGGE